jgi:hypothetical protein
MIALSQAAFAQGSKLGRVIRESVIVPVKEIDIGWSLGFEI